MTESTHVGVTPRAPSIGGVPIHSTKNIYDEHMRISACVMAKIKGGKTFLAASMDRMTKRFEGKPTLFLTREPSSGAGLEAHWDADLSFVHLKACPKKPHGASECGLAQLRAVLEALKTDTTYAGVCADSVHEIYNGIVRNHILSTPPKEKNDMTLKARDMGVMTDSDYNKSKELTRQILLDLFNLSTQGDSKDIKAREARKHVLVTVNQLALTDDDRRTVVEVVPDLPGQSKGILAGMVPILGHIEVQERVVDGPDGKRVKQKVYLLTTKAHGAYEVIDRTGLLPGQGPNDWEELYEKHWKPNLEKRLGKAAF